MRANRLPARRIRRVKGRNNIARASEMSPRPKCKFSRWCRGLEWFIAEVAEVLMTRVTLVVPEPAASDDGVSV